MRLLVTGGTGVLGRALRPVAEAAGHVVAMPRREELDRFDPSAVADAVRDVDGVLLPA
jgi:dTDP-4-dehydrorhamnose reductase